MLKYVGTDGEGPQELACQGAGWTDHLQVVELEKALEGASPSRAGEGVVGMGGEEVFAD